ncbi:MAG: FtsH protease activity modulator HflK [Bacteroidales bacterium]|nr:FtsH protease activity modulator HflK [Bacteroidales bacterium]
MGDYRRKSINVGGEEIQLPPINKSHILIGAVILIVVILFFTSFYTIKTDEVGVIKQFGKYTKTTPPGLHFKIPFGVETITKIKGRQYIFREEFGYRTTKPGVRTQISRDYSHQGESLMLTGDLNSASVEWVVQYRIKDPKDYLFNVRNITKTIRDVSESVTRQIAGDHSVDEVIILSRREIAISIREKMQEILDFYQTGVDIETVELQDVNPPDPVKPSFNEVNEARQEMEKMINQAYEAYNKVVPRAKGEAEKTIRQAEGYQLNRINRAKGDANKFNSVYEAYRQSRDVTKRRLYIETMLEVLPKIEKKYIIDKDQKGLLQLLQLQDKGGK